MLELLDRLKLNKLFLLFFLIFSLLLINLSKSEISNLKITSPLSKDFNNRKDKFKEIAFLLWQKPNSFKLIDTDGIFPKASASNDFDNALSYLVVDENSGKILAEKDSKKKLPIASLTKIMTAVVVLDLVKEDEVFTVSEKAVRTMPTKIGVVAGQKMTVKELLSAMLVTSANDAAEVLKEGIDEKYNAPIFEKAMNEKARFLGLRETNFDNPQGFDSENNYSSSEDLTILAHYALANYPLISEIVKKDYVFLPANSNHKQFDLYNWNGLLGVYPGVRGVKIGNTDKAETTTIVSSDRDNNQILVVVLGAPTVLKRDLWTADLLDLGFKSLGISPLVNVTEEQLLRKYATWRYWN